MPNVFMANSKFKKKILLKRIMNGAITFGSLFIYFGQLERNRLLII